ncbi:MAG TPA: aspartate kinase [Geminicoccus sp.]|uniref:aspartate kinase n=1 Tax=Geminicoccus sp. TaxID=2024832 RepID=UPI002E2EF951|nr:aspartate kinase [Geminicoccus sp.]HEX2529333.1 aspartate kinase [Geminicoccus sp.]
MALLVQKYGGTSVADPDRIQNVARLVKRAVDEGHQVAVVVSAMAGTTNQLVNWVDEIDAGHFDPAEYDTVVAAGEQVTSGLLAIALNKQGVRARSFQGWQIPLLTEGGHAKARIGSIPADNLKRALDEGQVAVISGFQGISEAGRIATLGRGGSDTSAVAIAAVLGAERCDIYTDVDGVYTTDPRIHEKAQKIDRITYEEMLELASLGAKVLQTRSVAVAMQHRVRVQVLSSFEDKPGTLVVGEDEIMESNIVTGIAHSRDEAKITLAGVNDKPGVAAGIFGPLAEANINVDMIVQSVSSDGATTSMTFTVGKADLIRAKALLDSLKSSVGIERVDADGNVVKISVVGVGMRSHAGVAHTMFRTLSERGINIQAISTSEIKVSVLIASDYMELAIRSLHAAYGLDAS